MAKPYPQVVLDALERDHNIRFRGRGVGPPDARLCYGVRCTWFGSIHETASIEGGLPCCPLCHGVLFEIPDEGEWWRGIDEFERGTHPNNPRPHPGYRAMWEWQRAQKRCFSLRLDGPAGLVAAYREATGVAVDLS